jgi:hypothetical protein
MKKIILSVIMSLFTCSMIGQQALWNTSDITSPEISGDGEVTFKLFAPKAIKVELVGDMLTSGSNIVEMKEGKNGVWNFSTQSLEPELYSYKFIVDGMGYLDPSNVISIAMFLRLQTFLLFPKKRVIRDGFIA